MSFAQEHNTKIPSRVQAHAAPSHVVSITVTLSTFFLRFNTLLRSCAKGFLLEHVRRLGSLGMETNLVPRAFQPQKRP